MIKKKTDNKSKNTLKFRIKITMTFENQVPVATLFPGSLWSGKKRDPGNEICIPSGTAYVYPSPSRNIDKIT